MGSDTPFNLKWLDVEGTPVCVCVCVCVCVLLSEGSVGSSRATEEV